ncbi:NUDIX hydrolase domain-like protein [Xylaria sp. FL0933]|nr:NUDIX hydrolase domain-like protein [Xylaria sp. FL0933]
MDYHAFFHPSVSDFEFSKRAYLDARPGVSFDYIATSALTLDTTDIDNARILLLQRATNAPNPNKWEPPGGLCDDSDKTIIHGAERELEQQAGLWTFCVSGPVGDPYFFTLDDGKKVCQFNFAVVARPAGDFPLKMEINPGNPRALAFTGSDAPLVVQLDSEKHQDYVWATEDQVKAKKVNDVVLDFISEEVARTVLLTFQHVRENWGNYEDQV